jgi:rubrerythrin
MNTTSLLDAIRLARENERIASERYAEAATAISHPMGKGLFTQLSEFERSHFEILGRLVKSLEESGKYLDYEGKAFPMPPVFEIKAAQDPTHKSIMTIISEAISLEQTAERTYTDLASQTDDPYGRRMFTRLAEEEHNHYRILNEAYWTLNELGEWRWSTV